MPGWLDSGPTLTAEQTRLVGLSIWSADTPSAPTWADGHHTGYYTFTLLRDRCPCPECAARARQRRAVATVGRRRHEEHA